MGCIRTLVFNCMARIQILGYTCSFQVWIGCVFEETIRMFVYNKLKHLNVDFAAFQG